MKEVKVLAKDGQRLMSTDLERANKLIEKGEAKLKKAFPLTIQMLKGTKRYMQEILKDSYDYEESTKPFTIPLGKMNVNDEEKDFVWNLSLDNESTDFPTLLVSAGFEKDRKAIVNSVAKHVAKNSDYIQFVLCDTGINYNNLQGQLGCVYLSSDSLDASLAAKTVEVIRYVMMQRFVMMESHQVNHIAKVKTPKTCYKINGIEHQWDEVFCITYRDENDNVIKTVATMEQIYNELNEGQIDTITIDSINSFVKLKDIEPVESTYVAKDIILCIGDMHEVMNSVDYKSVDSFTSNLGSLIRLSRAAGINLLLIVQRPTSGVLPGSLLNNITSRLVLGAFDYNVSNILFEKDISDEVKPEIKGRGFAQFNFRDIYEVQLF